MFSPSPLLLSQTGHPFCRACVILPARNEERSLAAALDALAGQVDVSGKPLDPREYEILLLLNNCTDQSAGVAASWRAEHPTVALSVIELTLPRELANVGTARRLLMDTAWERHHFSNRRTFGILSTDADSVVADDWVVRNLAALEQGADAVGGVIGLKEGELQRMPKPLRRAYENDLRYRALTAEFEDLLDPQDGDPWPRHLEHFGASLACTPSAYERAGGIPQVSMLEDVAFIDALRRIDARIRHDPAVRIFTSARLDGRAEIGLSFQLRLWERQAREGIEHRVLSAAFLEHRFRTLHALRRVARGFDEAAFLGSLQFKWRERLEQISKTRQRVAAFLIEIDCDRLIDETFHQEREGPIERVSCHLLNAIDEQRKT